METTKRKQGNYKGRTRIDLVGHTYGKLTVDSFAYVDDNGFYYWNCICQCGGVKIAHTALLRSGKTISCGCLVNKHNLEGKKFGKLTPIYATSQKSKSESTLWYCKCDCGNDGLFAACQLVAGSLKSCGCLVKETHWKGIGDIGKTYFSSIQRGALARGIEFKITIEYIWNLYLIQNKKCALSGIELCMPYTKNSKTTDDVASLDRIDSSKGYIEGNVQWIHKHINTMKNNKDEKYFIQLCKCIAEHKK